MLNRLALLLEPIPLRLDVIGDDHLDDGFRATVSICGADGTCLWNRDHVGEARDVSVDCCRGGEDDVGDVVFGHGAEEGDGAADVDAVVLERDLTRLTDGL